MVRLIRNSCHCITNFGHVWSDQTRVTHLQNVLCVIRTSVVLILDDMIVKDILKVIINDHASPGHDFITSKSRSKHGDTIMQVIEHI